jgi:hypothetical protein
LCLMHEHNELDKISIKIKKGKTKSPKGTDRDKYIE